MGTGQSAGVDELAQQLGQLTAFVLREWREHPLLDLVDHAVERSELVPACPGDRDDVAAPVVGIDGAFDESELFELAQHGHDVAAVHGRAAREVRLADRTPFLERGKQAVVVAAKAGAAGVTAAANAGVAADRAGLVAALLNSAQQVGGALGLAIFSALATSQTNHLLATGAGAHATATGGSQRALLAGAVFAAAAALISLRTANTHEDPMEAGHPTPAPYGGAAPGPATEPSAVSLAI